MGHSEKNIRYVAKAGGALKGTVRVASDKSISHRSIMFGSLAEGVTEVYDFLEGEDALATLKAFRDMGVSIEGPKNGRVTIRGVGMHGLKPPKNALDLGNSGTSMRLLSGLLAGQSFDCTLIGDKSLSGRPMRRVTDPLSKMGAKIDSTEKGTAPLRIHGGSKLKGIRYDMPMASAQVKSCLLLAGLYAEGETSVTEPGVTRDHTERMLQGYGYDVKVEGSRVTLQGGGKLVSPGKLQVPADISSSAFFLVGASIAPGSNLLLTDVGINPTRTGVIDILKLMGADLTLENQRMAGGEPIADIRVRSAKLKGINIPEELVPLAIDEFPALFVAAACAEGRTVLTGAEELRVKESDRIQAMADGLVALGVKAKATPDGIIIDGGPISGGEVDSLGDHRIAMSFTMAALRASGDIIINDCANVATSFPNFVSLSREAGLDMTVEG
ncbi:MAG: 3-phosphoshikimate 1-carboxyvinyltransferase [Gammaproteobacteria bacterium]|nr:3-phosphoshikimate 1-carboxyvinyltransferase [Gammaproteobacteria bacterium]